MNSVTFRKKARFGGLSIGLTIVLIAVIILVNVLFGAFANKFGWYVDMTGSALYSVSENCIRQLGEGLRRLAEPGGAVKPVRIIFLNSPDNLNAEVTQRYVYNTARTLENEFPDYIEVSWIDIWTYPDSVRKYMDQMGKLQSTMVVVDCGANGYRVISLNEFFEFRAADSTTPVGYNGDERFASAILTLLSTDKQSCYLTVNHGETYYDRQVLVTLVDAGYTLSYLNLLQEPIPDDCDLLLLYNPTADLTVADGVSQLDERVKLDAYMQGGGNMMVFLSDSVQHLPNLEGFLGSWNLTLQRHENAEGASYPYMVKDPSASLTSDGSTILGSYAREGKGAEWLAPMRESSHVPIVIFKNATSLQIGSDNASVRAYPLFTANEGSEAWSAGSLVSRGETYNLMTLSVNETAGSNLVVCTSSAFASEDYFMSVVFGNREVLQRVLAGMGKQDVLVDIDFKPFADSTIHSITTTAMAQWTVWLTAVPAVLVLGAAIIILVRRKNA